jgi:uncharacterized membrane protein
MMSSPASVLKHPIHPMLIPFPIALWIFSFLSDLIFLFEWGSPIWLDIALYTMIGGILGALAAAVPGYLDYRSLTDPAAQTIGWWHFVINLSTVALYGINVLLRLSSEPGAFLPIVLSLIGVGLLGVSGWLGGELVYVRGVAVEPASQAAPSRRGDRAAS